MVRLCVQPPPQPPAAPAPVAMCKRTKSKAAPPPATAHAQTKIRLIRRRTDGRRGTPSASRKAVSKTCMAKLYIGNRCTVNRYIGDMIASGSLAAWRREQLDPLDGVSTFRFAKSPSDRRCPAFYSQRAIDVSAPASQSSAQGIGIGQAVGRRCAEHPECDHCQASLEGIEESGHR